MAPPVQFAPPVTGMAHATITAVENKGNGIYYRPIVAIRALDGNGNHVPVYALIDSGSNKTVVTSHLTSCLNLETKKQCVTLTSLDATTTSNRDVAILDLQSLADHKFRINDVEVFVVDNLPVAPSHIARNSDVAKYPHLRDVRLHNLETDQVDLLIWLTLFCLKRS